MIYPLGREKTLDDAKTLSATYINLFNDSNGSIKVNIVDEAGNVVADFTIGSQERLTVGKPPTYSLSATSDILAVPTMRSL